MYENTGGRVTFLVYLMFRRLGKFDGPNLFLREERHLQKGLIYTVGLYSAC